MPTTMEVLRGTRRILEDGGDPDPCQLGPWCPYCCASIAKGDFDKRDGTELDMATVVRDVLFGFVSRQSDEPLLEATRLIGDAGAREEASRPGFRFTQVSGLAFVDAAIMKASIQ